MAGNLQQVLAAQPDPDCPTHTTPGRIPQGEYNKSCLWISVTYEPKFDTADDSAPCLFRADCSRENTNLRTTRGSTHQITHNEAWLPKSVIYTGVYNNGGQVTHPAFDVSTDECLVTESTKRVAMHSCIANDAEAEAEASRALRTTIAGIAVAALVMG